MSEYRATVTWNRNGEAFTDSKYSRGHKWEFDGGASIDASSAPGIVPVPYSVEEFVDPEEALVAAVSSCHMLFFLHNAAMKGFIVDSYTDAATGELGTNESGGKYISKITLKPDVKFSGEKKPTLDLLKKIHERSHKQCFIANSVKSEIVVDFMVPEGVE